MMRRLGCFFTGLFISSCLWGNNVKVDSVSWKTDAITDANPNLKLTFVVSWENAWRDLYNHDAVYVFFKFKKKEDKEGSEKTAKENWKHLFLMRDGHRMIAPAAGEFEFWLCPLSSPGNDFNTGVYIYRKGQGQWGENKLKMEVTWNIANQIVDKQLTANDIKDGKLLVSAHAIEMVYVPRGPFRVGDGVAKKGFCNVAFPLPPQYDVLNNSYHFDASSGNPRLAADRMNDNAATENSAWIGSSTGENRWWVDFGEGVEKKVTYFGVNAATHRPTYYPTVFRFEGSHDPESNTPEWEILWRGSGKNDWVMAEDSYPVAKAIKVDKPGNYRSYRIVVEGMNAGYPIVKSIGMMCESNLDSLLNHTVLVDGPATLKDSVTGIWAYDGAVWTKGELPATWPNGYKGFYAMKYEISQEQYAGFLNKLNYQQQNSVLEGRLDAMKEGDYIFDERYKASARNGIRLETKITGMPAVFACNLDKNNGADQPTDGQNVACNYMNIADMLAYADWSCLRPLSEMEYEKMGRRLYPQMPVKGDFAWGTTKIDRLLTADLQNPGTPAEKAVSGNANFDNGFSGPVRVGAFADKNAGRQKAGASFWGIPELSGNLAEIYYNLNGLGLQVLAKETGTGNTIAGHDTSHGDGSIDVSRGSYDGAKKKYWGENPAEFALRGGSFKSPAYELQVSDRTWNTGFFTTLTDRDSTVSFRLGHSVPDGDPLLSWLILENELTTETASAADIMVRPTYMLDGNVPVGTDERQCVYLWYTAENGGNWKVLDGECNRDYYFDKYKYNSIDTVVGYDYRFKRKVVTPYADSEISSAHQAVIKGAFAAPVELFTATGDTYQVSCEWDASIPRKWGLTGNTGTIRINEMTGVISGLNTTVCNNVTVTLSDRRSPDVVYTKQLKERNRDFLNPTVTSKSVTLTAGVYLVECWGAQGGSVSGIPAGKGGYTKGLLTLSSVRTVYVYAGGAGASYTTGGWNGGANGGYSDGGKGGGASDVRVGGNDLKDRIMVAGGGGGSPDGARGSFAGGNGGGLTGVDGVISDARYAYTAKGGTQTAGGVAGNCFTSYTNSGSPGSWGLGGAGSTFTTSDYSGGGGGGGYYGGGGACAYYQGGGAGGSSFISGFAGCNAVDAAGKHTGQPVHFSGLFFQSPDMQTGARSGAGLVRITVQ